MRKRSMSVHVPKESDHLSLKFEGIASDDVRSDSEHEKDLADESDAEEDSVLSENWTKEDYDALLEKLRAALPKRDLRKYRTTLQAMEWDKIELPNHSPEEVKQVSLMLISKVRNFKTLTEMLVDVPKVVEKLLEAAKPKPPLSAYNLFMRDNTQRWKQENKNFNSRDIFKLASSEYQKLPERKRRRYDDEAARLKNEYLAQLENYYELNPKERKMKPKSKKNLVKTPFNLFYQSRVGLSSNIALQQARKEWEQLPFKKKVKFIRESFEAEDVTKLNKIEKEMLDRYHGKPEYIGRNPYDYFARKLRKKYEEKNVVGTERERLIIQEYKDLSQEEILSLKQEYATARESYIVQYQDYITKLPEEKRQAEIEFVQSLVEKGRREKGTKKSGTEVKIPKTEDRCSESAEEDPPTAESTTISKPPKEKKSKKKKKKANQVVPDERADDISPPPSPRKKVKAVSPVKVAKQEPNESDSMSESVAYEDQITSTVSNSPSKNGRAEAKKRASPDSASSQVAVKKAKTSKAEKQETLTVKEPERPPKVIEEFYRQRIYRGKVGKHLESYANLSATKKQEIATEMKKAQKQYLLDFERFLKSLPKDRIQEYVMRLNAQQKSRETDSEEDDARTDNGGSGSSSSEEEDDD